jgi:hypothetical protein
MFESGGILAFVIAAYLSVALYIWDGMRRHGLLDGDARDLLIPALWPVAVTLFLWIRCTGKTVAEFLGEKNQ